MLIVDHDMSAVRRPGEVKQINLHVPPECGQPINVKGLIILSQAMIFFYLRSCIHSLLL
jgi:hypothetical protein